MLWVVLIIIHVDGDLEVPPKWLYVLVYAFCSIHPYKWADSACSQKSPETWIQLNLWQCKVQSYYIVVYMVIDWKACFWWEWMGHFLTTYSQPHVNIHANLHGIACTTYITVDLSHTTEYMICYIGSKYAGHNHSICIWKTVWCFSLHATPGHSGPKPLGTHTLDPAKASGVHLGIWYSSRKYISV